MIFHPTGVSADVAERQVDRFRQQGASDRHLRDVRAMLRVLGDSIDRTALARDIAELGLTAEWTEMENGRD